MLHRLHPQVRTIPFFSISSASLPLFLVTAVSCFVREELTSICIQIVHELRRPFERFSRFFRETSFFRGESERKKRARDEGHYAKERTVRNCFARSFGTRSDLNTNLFCNLKNLLLLIN